jgi:hypothetical protein
MLSCTGTVLCLTSRAVAYLSIVTSVKLFRRHLSCDVVVLMKVALEQVGVVSEVFE